MLPSSSTSGSTSAIGAAVSSPSPVGNHSGHNEAAVVIPSGSSSSGSAPNAMGTGSSSSVAGGAIPPTIPENDNDNTEDTAASTDATAPATAVAHTPITRADSVRKYNNIEDVLSPTTVTHSGETAVTPSKATSANANPAANGKRVNSLRRANIPPPLGLQSQPTTATSASTSNTTTTTNTTNVTNAPVSARLQIPLDPHARHFSIGSAHEHSPQRVMKPRVRYLGKLPRYGQQPSQSQSQQQQQQQLRAQVAPQQVPQPAIQSQAQQQQQQHQQMMLNAMMLQQQAQQQYMMMMGMYPYMYGGNGEIPGQMQGQLPMQYPMPYPMQYPMQMPLQSPMAAQPPRSAMLPNFPPQTYPYFRNQSTIDSSSSSLLNKGLHQSLNHAHPYTHTPTVPRIPEGHESSGSQPPSHRKSRSMGSAAAMATAGVGGGIGVPGGVTRSPTRRQAQGQTQTQGQPQANGRAHPRGQTQERSPASSSSSSGEDEEEADLAIESDALPTPVFTKPPEPPELMQGEVRIMQNKFSFEFPVNSPAVDRKMFLSICNKIWTESRELDKDI